MGATSVERLREFRGNDLGDLCDAAEEGIEGGGGFGWLKPPPRAVMESFWRGVLLIPERMLFVGRLDGVIAGTAQLLRPAKNNEAPGAQHDDEHAFRRPLGARPRTGPRHRASARAIVLAVEAAAAAGGALVLNLDVRESQEAAIQLYRSLGLPSLGHAPALCARRPPLDRRPPLVQGPWRRARPRRTPQHQLIVRVW